MGWVAGWVAGGSRRVVGRGRRTRTRTATRIRVAETHTSNTPMDSARPFGPLTLNRRHARELSRYLALTPLRALFGPSGDPPEALSRFRGGLKRPPRSPIECPKRAARGPWELPLSAPKRRDVATWYESQHPSGRWHIERSLPPWPAPFLRLLLETSKNGTIGLLFSDILAPCTPLYSACCSTGGL